MKTAVIIAGVCFTVLVTAFTLYSLNRIRRDVQVGGVFQKMKAYEQECTITLKNGHKSLKAKEYAKKLDNINEAPLPADFRAVFHEFRDSFDGVADYSIVDAGADALHMYEGLKSGRGDGTRGESGRQRIDRLEEATHRLKQVATKYCERFTD